MTKAFQMFLWENSPSVATPLGESMLNKVNRAVDEIDSRVVNFDTTKANQADLLTALADVSFNENTGVITFTKKNGSATKIDTKLEKLAVNFSYDSANQRLVITLDDGTIQYVDMKALITELEFVNSNTVLFSVTDGKVSASIVKGSITADMIEPNYLANVELYASQALTSANNASKSAQEAEASANRAEEAAEKAESIAGGDFASNAKVDNIINGTTAVGNANKLGGKLPSEYALVGDRYTSLSGYSSLLEWAKANPDSVAKYSGNGFEDCPFNKDHWGLVWNIATNTSATAHGIIVYAKANNGTTIYYRALNDSWANEWAKVNDGGNADTVDGYDSYQLLKALGDNPTDFRISQMTRVLEKNSDKFPGGFGMYVAFSCAINANSGRYVLHLYRWNGKLYHQMTSDEGEITKDGWKSLTDTADLEKYLKLDGSVPMSGKFRVSAPAESPLVVETTMNSANVFAMFKNNGVEQGCFGFTGPDKPVIVNSAHSSTKEIHHDGNSAKVIVSETPLTAKGSVRVW